MARIVTADDLRAKLGRELDALRASEARCLGSAATDVRRAAR
jgi:hypothetical protein